MPMPELSPVDVINFLGREDEPALHGLVTEHLHHVAELVNSYTRGMGFEQEGTTLPMPTEPDLRAVLTSVTARSVGNPARHKSESIGGYSATTLNDFTLSELAVLNRYRRRTA